MVVLDDPTTWPEQVTLVLRQRRIVKLLRKCDSIEDLARHPFIRAVLARVESCLAAMPLAAFHCTKQLPEQPFSAIGLRTLTIDQHHVEICELLRRREYVRPELLGRIETALERFRRWQGRSRDKMLWFCIDRHLVLDRGTAPFFKYFGGEAVYLAFKDDPEIGPLFEQIGNPVVVVARISSKYLTVFQEFALARTLVSYFARSVNPKFRIESREGYLSKDVDPCDIIAVHPQDLFVKMLISDSSAPSD